MTPVYVRAAQLGLLASIAGAVAGGLVAARWLNLPPVIGGVGISVVGAVVGALMPEREFRRTGAAGADPAAAAEAGADAEAATAGSAGIARRSWALFADQLRESRIAILAVPGFALLLGMTFFTGLWSESFDRLWGAFLLQDFRFPTAFGLKPAVWFSVIAVAVSLLSLGSTELAKRRIDRLGGAAVAGTLLTLTLLIAAGVLAMAGAPTFAFAVAAYLLVQVLRPVAYPLLTGWIVGRVDSRVRATALSARDMFDSGGQIAGGPLIGWIGLIATVRTALFAGALALAPAAGLLLAATRRIPVRAEPGAAEPIPTDAAEPIATDADGPIPPNAASGVPTAAPGARVGV